MNSNLRKLFFTDTSNTKLILFPLLITAFALIAIAQSTVAKVGGAVLDPAGFPLAVAQVEFYSAPGASLFGTTRSDDEFARSLPASEAYTVHVKATGFVTIKWQRFDDIALVEDLQMNKDMQMCTTNSYRRLQTWANADGLTRYSIERARGKPKSTTIATLLP